MSPPTEALAKSQHASPHDPFDELLTLEDTLYTTAHDLGVKDGARAGRIEGRIFGLEKGFDKFSAMGMLHGRACVWGGRLPTSKKEKQSETNTDENNQASVAEQGPTDTVPRLPNNPRLAKHISLLHGLTDPSTFATDNTEDAVADFDDRFKRAGAKAKVIERIVNETDSDAPSTSTEAREGAAKSPKRTARNVKMSSEKKTEESMEDFAGSRLLA